MQPLNHTPASLEERQSTLIKAMRFPLICLVVAAHAVGFPWSTLELSLDGWNVFRFVSVMLCRHLFSIGTCWFFVFSGYLFLRYLKEEEFGMGWVLKKWKKRLRTLLVPYLIWNALAVLVILVKTLVFARFSLGRDGGGEWAYTISQGPLFWFFTGPADFPLWFMRDLLLLSLIVPLLYLLFKRFKWASLVLLVLVYLSPWNPTIPTMRSIFFFCLGAWLGTFKLNMLSLCRKVRIPALIAAAILLPLAASQVGRPLHQLLLRLFYPCGMMVFMLFVDALIDNEKRCRWLCGMAGCVFFIYAAHEIYILSWTKGLMLRIFGSSLAGTWASFWLVPPVVLLVCIALYHLLNRIMPRTLAFASGGRSKKE